MSNLEHRAAAIVIEQGRLLLVRRHKPGQDYYVFPGGHIETGESSEQAAVRELKEETSIDGASTGLACRLIDPDGTVRHYFLCQYLQGEPALGAAPERARQSADNIYEPMWLPANDLPASLRPAEVRNWLEQALRAGFPDRPVVLHRTDKL